MKSETLEDYSDFIDPREVGWLPPESLKNLALLYGYKILAWDKGDPHARRVMCSGRSSILLTRSVSYVNIEVDGELLRIPDIGPSLCVLPMFPESEDEWIEILKERNVKKY